MDLRLPGRSIEGTILLRISEFLAPGDLELPVLLGEGNDDDVIVRELCAASMENTCGLYRGFVL